MIQKQFFAKHHKRLVTEAILRAAMCGLLIGSCANFLAAMFAWYYDFGGILFAIGVGAGVGLIAAVILYAVKFKPSIKELAYRVDRLGLEERMVTMLEFQNDDSVIARLQRENAKEHLKDVEDKKLRMRLPKVVSVLAVLALILGCGMTTVVALAANDIISSGEELINPEDPLANYLAVTYLADEGGEILGEADQLLLPGEDTLPVTAVAEDGWVFVGWDDGNKNPERQEKEITSGALYVAMFEQIGENGDGTGENEGGEGGNGSGEGDQAPDVPAGGESNADSNQGGAGDKGSGQGADSDKNNGGEGEGEEQGEGKGDGKGQGAGGTWDDSNFFLDGETYYKDYLDMYYEMAQEFFEDNSDIPPELREFFENYFNGI